MIYRRSLHYTIVINDSLILHSFTIRLSTRSSFFSFTSIHFCRLQSVYSAHPIFNDDKFPVDLFSIPIVAHCRSGFLRRLLISPSCLYISRFRFVAGDTTARVDETQDLSFSIEQSRVRKAMLAAGTIRVQWNEEIVRHWMIVWTTHRSRSKVLCCYSAATIRWKEGKEQQSLENIACPVVGNRTVQNVDFGESKVSSLVLKRYPRTQFTRERQTGNE